MVKDDLNISKYKMISDKFKKKTEIYLPYRKMSGGSMIEL